MTASLQVRIRAREPELGSFIDFLLADAKLEANVTGFYDSEDPKSNLAATLKIENLALRDLEGNILEDQSYLAKNLVSINLS